MDFLDYSVTKLTNADMPNCHRFRVECRGVDSSDQSVELFDYTEPGPPGSILFAFKTNVEIGSDEERRRLVQGIAQLLIDARHANGDEA